MTGIVIAEPGSAMITVASDQLVRVELISKHLPPASLEPYTTQFDEYLRGQRRVFDLPYSFEATRFQRRVFSIVQSIPYGLTMTYSEVARTLGNVSAARAVGNTLSRNPLHIIVPCHRVTASSGIGGFCPTAGTGWKAFLIDLEKQVAKTV